MFTVASNFGRAGICALGVLTGFGGTAITAPIGPIDRPIPAAGSNLPIELAQGGYRGGLPRARGPVIWPRHGGGAWNGRGGAWRGGNWNRNWRGRPWYGGHGHYGHYHNYYDDNIGIFLGLGLPLLGLGLGGYDGGYYPGYYNGYYPGYANGGYYPRRYYRAGNGHVRWCYSRYRSYRAWDNTYQPYNGPRRQCYSPYG
jgi:BA14K-like protein